jgi:hypothetical protein
MAKQVGEIILPTLLNFPKMLDTNGTDCYTDMQREAS